MGHLTLVDAVKTAQLGAQPFPLNAAYLFIYLVTANHSLRAAGGLALSHRLLEMCLNWTNAMLPLDANEAFTEFTYFFEGTAIISQNPCGDKILGQRF